MAMNVTILTAALSTIAGSFELLGLFTAGVATFFTPCVLPLIPIYLSALIGTDITKVSKTERGQLVQRALLFSVGFIAVFTLMGLTASSIGGFLTDHKGILQGIGALLILIFGLKFLGLIRIPFFDKIVRADDTKMQTRFGGINAVVMGVVFAAGWSPCVGPVLGSVLTYTASQAASPWVGAGYLALYGCGFAVPLLITAIFAEAAVKLLKKVNRHLPRIERAIGILLVLVAGSLLFDLWNSNQSQVVSPHEAGMTLTLDEQGERWPVMVEFYSENCPICKRMEPIISGIAGTCNGNQVLVRQIDLSDPANAHYAETFRLRGVPTFVFVDDNAEEVARLIGEQTEGTLMQALSALRGKPCPGLGTLPMLEGETTPLFPTNSDEGVSCGSEHLTDTPVAKDCDGEPEPAI
jgi:cytochrome c-type biogenesis protein